MSTIRPVQSYRRRSEDPGVRPETTATFEAIRNRKAVRSQTSRIIPPRSDGPQNPQLGKSPTGKKSVQEPMTVPQFFVVFIIDLCKEYVLFHPGYKAPLYLFIVFIVSCVGDLIRPRRTMYLSRPGNFFSVYLVKFAEYWTFVSLFLFVILTSYIYCGGRIRGILRNLSRIVIGFLSYFCFLSFFDIVQHFSSFCSNEDIKKEKICVDEGHRWISFDVSDDAFSLIFLSLIIMEEAKCFARWEILGNMLKREPNEVLIAPEQSNKNISFVQKRYRQLSGLIKIVFFIMTILCIIWDAMLFMTAYFYQSLPQKISGAVIATLYWALTYQFWFANAWPYLPGIGIIRNLVTKKQRIMRR